MVIFSYLEEILNVALLLSLIVHADENPKLNVEHRYIAENTMHRLEGPSGYIRSYKIIVWKLYVTFDKAQHNYRSSIGMVYILHTVS